MERIGSAAQHDAENDGAHGEAFDPAVRDDELLCRQKLRENAVLGGGIGCGADADDGVGEKRMSAEKHQQAPHGFEGVREKHDAALRHRIGKDADPGCEKDVAHNEKELEERRLPVGCSQAREERNGCNEKRIVRKRGQKLRRHDGVKAAVH